MGNLNIQCEIKKLVNNASIAIVTLEGSIDASTVKLFEGETIGLTNKGVQYLILNCTRLGYMNSTGLGVLVKVMDHYQAKSGDIKLVKVLPKVRELFDMLGIASILKIYPTTDEALASLPAAVFKEEAPPEPGEAEGIQIFAEDDDKNKTTEIAKQPSSKSSRTPNLLEMETSIQSGYDQPSFSEPSPSAFGSIGSKGSSVEISFGTDEQEQTAFSESLPPSPPKKATTPLRSTPQGEKSPKKEKRQSMFDETSQDFKAVPKSPGEKPADAVPLEMGFRKHEEPSLPKSPSIESNLEFADAIAITDFQELTVENKEEAPAPSSTRMGYSPTRMGYSPASAQAELSPDEEQIEIEELAESKPDVAPPVDFSTLPASSEEPQESASSSADFSELRENPPDPEPAAAAEVNELDLGFLEGVGGGSAATTSGEGDGLASKISLEEPEENLAERPDVSASLESEPVASREPLDDDASISKEDEDEAEEQDRNVRYRSMPARHSKLVDAEDPQPVKPVEPTQAHSGAKRKKAKPSTATSLPAPKTRHAIDPAPPAPEAGEALDDFDLASPGPSTSNDDLVHQPAPASLDMLKKQADRGSIKRKTAVRYFERMNPLKKYPLGVIFSKEKIAQVQVEEAQQAHGNKVVEVKEEAPEILVTPCMPGCVVNPTSISVDISPKASKAEFWVTPVVEGEIEGWVEISYQGKVVDKIDLYAKSARHTLAKVSAGFAFASPIGSYLLDCLEWNTKKGLSQVVQSLNKSIGIVGIGLILATIFVAASLFFYYRNKDKEAEILQKFYEF